MNGDELTPLNDPTLSAKVADVKWPVVKTNRH